MCVENGNGKNAAKLNQLCVCTTRNNKMKMKNGRRRRRAVRFSKRINTVTLFELA